MKRRAVSLLLLGALLFLLLPGAATAAELQFTDTQNHWAKDCILTFASRGFIEGYPDGTFRPDKPISRAEFTCILLNSMGATPSDSTSAAAFNDTAKHWAHAQIAEAVRRGILIVSEYPNGLKPDGPILRSEAAAMMIRALGKQPDLTATTFKDQSQIAKSMYRGYIKTAYVEGLMHGYTDGTFQPFSEVKRGEACAMLSNLLDKIGAPGVSSGSTGSTGTGSLTGLVLQSNRYDPTSSTVSVKQGQANVPIYALSLAGGLIYINNTLRFALNSTSGNPDLVVNNTRYTNCQLSVSGSDLSAAPASVRLDSLSHNDYKYNADYVNLYIGNKNSDNNLSDAELVDQHTLKIAGKSYDINNTQIAIALGDNFYAIKRISFASSGTSLNLVATDPVVVNGPDLSDILAIFVDSHSQDLNDIHDLSLIIDGDLYDLSDVAIDASGNFTASGENYTPDQVTMDIDGSSYKLNDAKSLEGKFIFYCTASGETTWVKINDKYRDAGGIQILKDNDTYSLDDILVVRHNVVRIGGRQYTADDIQCRFDGMLYNIDDIDYDDDLDLVTMDVTESTNSWGGDQPEEYVFYLNNSVYQDGVTSDVTIYADGDWRSFSKISLADPSHFTYNDSTYSLVGAEIQIDNDQFVIIDSAWRVSSQILNVYLQTT